MDRFEVFGLDHIACNARFIVEPDGEIAHQIFDELGVVVGALGDELFIRPFEDAIELARGFILGNINQFFDPELLA